MNRSPLEINITDDEHGIDHFLESKLLASLRNSLPQGDNSNFVLSARDSENRIVGGLIASTSYGWLLIKVVWVDDAFTKQGLGRSLMERAEQKGVDIGCHAAWLDTSNPAAMEFYLKLGYKQFGLLSNIADQAPENHKRWFMQKALLTTETPQ